MNLVFINSIIDPPNHIPYSWEIGKKIPRSIFSKDERFEQTKNTIKSVKNKIPNSKIILVECSKLSNDENNYFINNVDYFINLFDIKDNDYITTKIYGDKGYGERNMTIEAIKYIIDNNINFDNFFKISGRYLINDCFNYDFYNNNNNIFITSLNHTWCTTYIYKLNKISVNKMLNFLVDNEELFIKQTSMERAYTYLLDHLYPFKDTLVLNSDLINNFNDGITKL